MLERLKRLDRSIQIAIVGVGSMGKGPLHQSRVTPGIRCVAIADIDLARAVAAAGSLGCACRVVREPGDLQRAIRAGILAICEDGELLARCELVDALIEASNSIIPAARVAITALEHRRHLVLMNSEIDLTFGPYLLQLARENDVTYSSCDGDQHGVIRHLVDDLCLWGFALVMAGNIKGFLDRYANPATIVPEADKRNLGYRMATAYTDGSKLLVEMALLANALGLAASVPGMRGPRTNDVHDVFRLFEWSAADSVTRRAT